MASECGHCGGPVVGRRRDARFCGATCRRRDRNRRERERYASDPAYRAERQVTEREASRRWAKANPDKIRTMNARRDSAALSRKWREEHPEFFASEEYKARELARLKEYQKTPDQREKRRVRQAARRARSCERLEPLVVLERHDGVCGICGGDVDPFAFHMDHIVPLARGGAHTYANLQPAHPSCNVRKGADLGE